LNPQPLPPRAQEWRVAQGNYQIYLIWRSALDLKLRTDWMEPAHIGVTLERFATRRPLPYPQEPAHWFDAQSLMAPEEIVLIQAIDQVYPDLKLADRITANRSAARQIGPGVREPAHFRAGIREPAHFFRAGIREPAHLAQLDRAALSERAVDMLSQVAEMLRQAGF